MCRLAVYKSVTLADLCEFFFFFLDLIANCSQIKPRCDVKTLGSFKSHAQTATCQHAEHEKWRDCIYPAYSTLARPFFYFFIFALLVETNNNNQEKKHCWA